MFKDYSNRVIVFMDILGFKNIVNEYDNKNVKKNLFDVIGYLKWIKEDNYTGLLHNDVIGKEVTVFSDSIVISYDVSLPGQVFYILLDIIHIQLDLASRGILLRGGVSIGDLVHKNEIVFGPAMVAAYELESKHAKYPRIIVDEKLIEYAYIHPSNQNTSEQEVEYIVSLLREDKDGYFYTNFLNQSQELDCPSDIYTILANIKEKINNYIDNKDEKIREKYEWLKEYYNSVCTERI